MREIHANQIFRWQSLGRLNSEAAQVCPNRTTEDGQMNRKQHAILGGGEGEKVVHEEMSF